MQISSLIPLAIRRPAPRVRLAAVSRLLVLTMAFSMLVLVPGATTQRVDAQAPETTAVASDTTWTEVGRAVGEGEQCIVCNQPIDDDEAVEIRYKGRTFHVNAGMLADFADDPDRYFVSLQAQGALFDERAMEGRKVSLGWLILGGYILIGLIAAASCGALAISRGLEPLPWFFAGLIGNVAAIFVLVINRQRDTARTPDRWTKVRRTHAPTRCSKCGADNHPSAHQCQGCNAAMDPAFQAEAARA